MQEFKNSEAIISASPNPRAACALPPRHRRPSNCRRKHHRHTPKDENIRVFTGNSFDLHGERKRTHIHVDSNHNWLDEPSKFACATTKTEPANIRVVEHLYAGPTGSLPRTRRTGRRKTPGASSFRFHCRAGWRTGHYLHGALFVVKKTSGMPRSCRVPHDRAGTWSSDLLLPHRAPQDSAKFLQLHIPPFWVLVYSIPGAGGLKRAHTTGVLASLHPRSREGERR